MKTILTITIVLLMVSLPAVAQESMNSETEADDLYCGQKPPGKKAEVFQGMAISPNGKYLFFVSRRNGPDFVTCWADASFIEKLNPKHQ